MYINDLCALTFNTDGSIAFGDDAALLFSKNNCDEVFNAAPIGLNTVYDWLQLNVLTLNICKAKYVVLAQNLTVSLLVPCLLLLIHVPIKPCARVLFLKGLRMLNT